MDGYQVDLEEIIAEANGEVWEPKMRMGETELHKTIREERKEAKRKCAAKLRYLTSCDAERLNDYQRINHLVSVGAEAAALLESE